MLGHDAAHRQIFRSGRWNDWVTLIIGNLLVGMSYGWWQHKHTRHHANPNKIGVDPDIELPVISVTPAQADRRAGWRGPLGWTMAHQGVFFFPILLLEGLSLHASSVRRVFSPEPLRRRPVEISLLTIRLAGYLTLVFLILSPGIAFAFLGVQLGLFGFYMGMAFAPNHKGMPLVPKDVKLDFLRRQVLMSRNIAGNRVLDTVMGGLNYQIEHHLFPSMPRPHLRAASPMIAAYCRSHGVAYTRTGLWDSYRIVVRYINRVGLGERDPFECPLLVARQAV
jgi:fatty acid desaturase